MTNQFVKQRLEATLTSLNASYTATAQSASAVKGTGRSDFIHKYLEQVVPPSMRIRTNGEITDSYNNKTGELDIIIENGMFPSIPLINVESSKLYFAEGVAAVIEVKSNLAGQWNEVLSTGEKLSQIKRNIAGGFMRGSGGGTVFMVPTAFNDPDNTMPKLKDPKIENMHRIPYFVVGYTGWATQQTINQKLAENSFISGILQLDLAYYTSNDLFKGVTAPGAWSLLGFIDSIYEAYNAINSGTADLLSYAMDK